MHVRRLAAAGLLAAAAVPAVPAPALAHGSPTTPISRNSACAGNGTRRDTAACKAALKATDGFLGAYDNLRLASVADDRERVPDGKLCSGGLDNYRGLDLARDDFPATKVKSGRNLKIAYRGTIPHQGSFRLFLTESGYDPAEKLAWGDLTKLDEIKDPPLTGGSYRMTVDLPKRTGRHILYVVWETSSTPDTYYSCSDLVFPDPVPVATKAAPSPSPSKVPSTTPSAPPTVTPSAQPVLAATRKEDTGMIDLGHWLIGGAIGIAALVAAGAGLSRLRRRETR
ncbi:chitin-binding protein [Actinoplanes derwentensis]|uniref:Chitin-binding protein n=2 Tax=Actinoplanes derwentensis TaxID=113562 RepID=A0A1H1QM34_9ACTN|nr:chitin-binding protein [Actinoplanes derwentensis]